MNNIDRFHIMERENQQIPTFGKYWLRGLLTINTDKGKEGIYIAEYQTDPQSFDIPIAVYGVKKVNFKNQKGVIETHWDKNFEEEEEKHTVYSPSTKLAAIKGEMLGKNNTYSKTIKKYFPPLFVTIIETGTDSFTGKKGHGFYEETPSRLQGKNFVRGNKTGIFICLDSFHWKDAQYRASDMRKYAEELKADDDLDFR